MNNLFDFAAIEAEITSIDEPGARLRARNRLMDELFVGDVKRAGWVLQPRGERLKIPAAGRAIVVGTVVWNSADRELLKKAASLMAGFQNVFVVNLDDVRSPADLDTVMPGVPTPTETPVIAEYEDGTLKRVAAGQEAHALLTETRSLSE